VAELSNFRQNARHFCNMAEGGGPRPSPDLFYTGEFKIIVRNLSME